MPPIAPPQSLSYRFSLLIRRLKLRIEGIFDQAWAIIPAQPVLNTFMFFAVLAVIFIDSPPIAFEDVGVGSHLFYAWCALSLAGPLGIWIARHLIMNCTRRKRLFGFWLRTAADIMQFLALSAYLVARLFVPLDDGLLYSQIVITGIWLLQALWIIRDVWALVLIERTASHLNTIVYGR